MQNIENNLYDIAIIGAGPVGLFTVFQAGMLGLSCIVIDANSEIGGQCTALYPEKPIYDIPAHPAIKASDLIEQLSKQNVRFKPLYLLNSKLINIAKNSNDIFELELEIKNQTEGEALSCEQTIKIHTEAQSCKQIVQTEGKPQSCGQEEIMMHHHAKGVNIIYAKTVILATGGGSLEPKKLPIANAASLENKHIFYAIKHLNMFYNKDVLIAGGGDSAVDWALSILNLNANNNFYLMHRRDKFTAMPENVNELKRKLAHKSTLQKNPSLLLGYTIKNISLIQKEIDNASNLDNNIIELDSNINKLNNNNPTKLDSKHFNNTKVDSNAFEQNSKHYILDNKHHEQDSKHHNTIEDKPYKLLIELEDINSNECLELKVDYLLPFYGLEKDALDFKKWGLDTSKNAILVDQYMQSNIPGIFAIGDCASYETKLKLILTGFSESSIACHAIYKIIHGIKPKHEYSTCKQF